MEDSTPRGGRLVLATIAVTSFRGLDDASHALSPGLTLVSGRNGSGKTALLDAISIALGALVNHLGAPAPGLRIDDARLASSSPEGAPPPLFPVTVTATGTLGSAPVAWSRRLSRAGDTLDPGDDPGTLGPLLVDIVKGLADGTPVDLPLLACYTDAPHSGEPPAPIADPRLSAYSGCLSLDRTEIGIPERLAHLVTSADTDPSARAALLAVTRALTECVGDSDPVKLDVFAGALHLTIGAGLPLPWTARGAAFRRVAALFADLALRCCALNPHRGASAPLHTGGVVLIDAIEAQLALHPRWQRYLLDDLRRVFPLSQIVASTSSPFVLQAIDDGALLDLDKNPPVELADLSIEDITEQVMSVRIPQRSKRFLDMQAAAAEYLRLLPAAKGAPAAEVAAAKHRMDALLMPFSKDQAFCAFLRMQRLAAGIDLDDDEEG